MTEAQIAGGSDDDRKKLLELHEQYLVANGKFDWPGIENIWSEAPHATFFNLNGHTYKGSDHWTRLWQFYEHNVKSSYWTPFDIGGVVSDGLAVVWCERHTRSEWVGQQPPPPGRMYGDEFTSRSTMAFRKEGGDWRVVHVHFSPASTGPRPGGV